MQVNVLLNQGTQVKFYRVVFDPSTLRLGPCKQVFQQVEQMLYGLIDLFKSGFVILFILSVSLKLSTIRSLMESRLEKGFFRS